MSLKVISSGPLSTVQDLGRSGWRHLGVGLAGALDADAARIANRLVGNAADAAVIECTLQAPTLELLQPCRLAICGAPLQGRYRGADDSLLTIDSGRRFDLLPGRIELGRLRGAARAWIAVSGGIDVAAVLGSRSTDLRAGFGGLLGRALAADDVLPLGAARTDFTRSRAAPWSIRVDAPPRTAVLRYVPSAQPAAVALARREWQIDARSNRQGLRLSGDALPSPPANGISAAVAPGTIQLPPDGQPIVLLADAQTVGGYPRLGDVIGADRNRLAQLLPGQRVRFEAVSVEQARELATQRAAAMAALEHAIAQYGGN
ncbi:biotin-dependent carboxyltransferase family protein [Solimonas marina]|uniref:Biotin-dependent carboxyltransferase family protein n=1 Tax=Solimonas marina TaxID=2714601 RepID=A0A969WDC8_9GAMM|nr:biotin-dependent carboxyltransferase family protein [Solimonas marina]NKF23326.1 biotin-dependent carboxyltransferase family protein [Solimonas marina]